MRLQRRQRIAGPFDQRRRVTVIALILNRSTVIASLVRDLFWQARRNEARYRALVDAATLR